MRRFNGIAYDYEWVKIEDFKGLVFEDIELKLQRDSCEDYIDAVIFKTDKGRIFRMAHDQDCCEFVRLQEIHGDIKDLIGEPIVMAEEVVSDNHSEIQHDFMTWTFYKLATIKGYVTLRWLGESNGYYSEDVDIIELFEERS